MADNPESVAHMAEDAVTRYFRKYHHVRVTSFTPSIVEGRRYIGVTFVAFAGDKQFAIEINVTEVKEG